MLTAPRRRDRQVRRNSSRRGHHDQAGARSVDRSFILCYGRHSQEQGAHPLAVVHSALLPGSAAEHSAARIQTSLRRSNHLGKIGLTVTLFLIGTGLNKETLKQVGVRPLLQGLALWIIVGVGTLTLILFNWIRV